MRTMRRAVCRHRIRPRALLAALHVGLLGVVVLGLAGPGMAMDIRRAAVLHSTLPDNVGSSEQMQLGLERATLWQNYLRAFAIQTDILDDATMAQGLMGYQLLILPDIRTLSDRQREVALNFMRRGHAVLLTGQAGSRRRDGSGPTLSDALGLRYRPAGSSDTAWWVMFDEPSVLSAGLPRMQRLSVEANPPVAIPAGQGGNLPMAFWLSGSTPRGLYHQVDHQAAIHAGSFEAGRFVWLGFTLDSVGGDLGSTEAFHRLLTNAFHFFHGGATFELEPWPYPYRYACLFSMDVEERFGNIRNVTSLPNLRKMTYFILTNPAGLHHDVLTQVVADDKQAQRDESGRRRVPWGEIAVHGDDHARFEGQPHAKQRQRLEHASRYIQNLTGIRPLGFRPPEEAYDYYTLQTMIDLGYRYLLANREPDRAEPIIRYVAGQPLVQIAMVNGDDVQWVAKAGHPSADHVLAAYIQDMNGIFRREGLYVVNFHSQILATSQYIRVLEDMTAYAEMQDAWLVTGAEVYDWWVKRDQVHVQVLERSGERLRVRVIHTGDQPVENLGVSVWLPMGVRSPRITAGPRRQQVADYQTRGNRLRFAAGQLAPGESMEYEVTWQR